MAAVTYLSSNSFSVPGDVSALFPPSRALMALLATKKTGVYVVSATYDPASLSTVIVTTGAALDSTLSGILFGQAPDNSPFNPIMTGATSAASGGPGRVPAPEAGQHNSMLAGDGAWRDSVIESELWSY